MTRSLSASASSALTTISFAPPGAAGAILLIDPTAAPHRRDARQN
jgi:hypothetical protein